MTSSVPGRGVACRSLGLSICSIAVPFTQFIFPLMWDKVRSVLGGQTPSLPERHPKRGHSFVMLPRAIRPIAFPFSIPPPKSKLQLFTQIVVRDRHFPQTRVSWGFPGFSSNAIIRLTFVV